VRLRLPRWCHFRPADVRPSDEPELGYRLRRSAWGKGYAIEGWPALIRKGFTELGVRRMVVDRWRQLRRG
jgi:RimJ/RimL family protein N-acetyltransferase